MEIYKLFWKESVKKDFRKLPSTVISRVVQKAGTLSNNPFPAGSIKLKDTLHTYRLRIGDYRLIYQVDSSAKEITICYVRHRKDVYRSNN